MDLTTISLREAALVFGICASLSLAGAIGLLIIAAQQVARIEIPENADFFETLQLLPITVPLALDLLDMAFDIFAAPIAWIVLELLGLQALQMVTVFEGLIPGTQLIPTLTGAWVIARIMKKRQPETELRTALHQYQLERRTPYGRRSDSLAEGYHRRALPLPDDDEDFVEGEYYEEDSDYLPIDDLEDEEPW